MPRKRLIAPTGTPPEPPADGSSNPVGEQPLEVRQAANVATLQRRMRPLTECEEIFSQLYVLYRNRVKAYKEAFQVPPSRSMNSVYAASGNCIRHPWVLARIRELEGAAAAAIVIDVAALLEKDRAIVEAADHINDLVSHVWHCCRHCNGEGHAYQWIDENEYYTALAVSFDVNAERIEKQKPPLPEPTCTGGYGFLSTNEPNLTCPKCEGRGVQLTIFADTRNLEGPAAALYKGIEETKFGKKLLLHDVDKAKDRLYRAAGAFHDDAASVARGAAAGAAAGAAIGKSAIERMEGMTAEQAARLFLDLA